MVKLFRIVGILEGLSFLVLLLIAMPLKYMAGMPEAVRLVGSLHGGLFLVYLFFALQVASELNWAKRQMAAAFIAATVPLGTFYFDRKYMRNQA